jgi:hypothetical protein
VIDVFEQVELDGFAGAVGGLDSIDDDAPHAADEIAIEERDGGLQSGVELRLPVPPLVPIEIAARHAPPVIVEQMQVIGSRHIPCAVAGE